MRRNPYEAGGFAFPNGEMRDKAQREIDGIRYVKEHTQMDDPETVLKVYCQLINQKLFETPVGYHFLSTMQEYLMSVPYFMTENIPPIPVAASRGSLRAAEKSGSGDQEAVPRQNVKVVKKVVTEKKVQNVNFKTKFRASFFFNVILILIVAGMFAVTATSGNINIINYENELIEKYENWESKLEEKEEQLKEREKALREQEQQ
ncbi:MAG: hypothetical protein K2P76_06945 [Lachnospiraceae bacterium]|nr:hypothetical protein [Lachnospiraceae bacterium]